MKILIKDKFYFTFSFFSIKISYILYVFFLFCCNTVYRLIAYSKLYYHFFYSMINLTIETS